MNGGSALPDEENGPSPHAVSLARFWLAVLGSIWLFLGFGSLFAGVSALGLPVVGVFMGMAHLLAACYASRRIAVLLAWF